MLRIKLTGTLAAVRVLRTNDSCGGAGHGFGVLSCGEGSRRAAELLLEDMQS